MRFTWVALHWYGISFAIRYQRQMHHLKMEKRIRRNLRLTRPHRVLELYSPRATHKMKLIRIRVKFLFSLSRIMCSLHKCINIIYYALTYRSNCIDTWAFYDRTRKATLPKWETIVSLHTGTFKTQRWSYVLYHFFNIVILLIRILNSYLI